MSLVGRDLSLIFALSLFLSSCPLGSTSPEIKVQSVEPQQYFPETEILDNELILVTNVTRLVLHCQAHYPVQWQFNGSTSPLQVELRAFRKSGPKLSDPTFIAELVIFRVSAAITGSYRCQSVQNPNKEEFVHIFAQDKGYRGQDPILLKYGMTVDVFGGDGKSIVTFPCAVWDPRQPVHLYRLSEVTGKYELVKSDGGDETLVFDPKVGFRMNLNKFDKPWGKYLCSPKLERTFDRVYVNLHPKPDYKVSPANDLVEVPEGQVLVLKCEATQGLKWNILGGLNNDSRIEIKYETDPESFYSQVSTLTFSDLTVSDESRIQCLKKQDSSPIHTWSYQVVGTHDIKRRGFVRYFSRRTRTYNFACWARTSKSPDVNFVECKNPMECQIRGQCLKNADTCDAAAIRKGSGGTIVAQIENRTGILVCNGDGVSQEIRQFIGVSGVNFYDSVENVPQEERLLVEGTHVLKEDSVDEFRCTGSSFLYAGGFRWGLKSHGNSVRVLEPTSSEVLRFEETFLPSGNILAKALLKLKSSKFTELTCFAPYWNTTDWDSRTHRIVVHG